MKYINKASVIITGLGGFIASKLGGYDLLLNSIVTLVVIDYITGLIKSLHKGNFSAKKGLIGISKKVVIFMVISASVVATDLLGKDVRYYTIILFSVNEFASILENANVLYPIPDKLQEIVEQLKGLNKTN